MLQMTPVVNRVGTQGVFIIELVDICIELFDLTSKLDTS